MRKHLILTLFVLFSSATSLLAQPDEIIKIKPQTLVNDFAAIFTREQVATLERRLVDFNDTTTNVVVIVTVNDLEDYPSWQLAYEIGYSWGVQHEEDANGVVILIKPRNETAGDVAISVGYSLEGVIPDILAKRIIDEQMIPALREGDYYGAVTKALDEMLPLIADEIAYEREKGNPVAAILVFAIFFGLIILIIILIVKKGGQQGGSPGSHSNNRFWRALWLASLGSGNSGGSGRGNGGFGSSRGGFGGFGGRGGFGGGGASGKF